jgi:hypothetical protein
MTDENEASSPESYNVPEEIAMIPEEVADFDILIDSSSDSWLE